MLHQKTTQSAIAAMSRLAELHAAGGAASSAEIAHARNLPQPVVAKLLTALARAGLITGSPGPGGGYRLAKPANEISLWDIVQLFERTSESPCPFGPIWCGTKEPCPLHQTLLAMQQIEENYLKSTNFAVFQGKNRSK
jgi:Rrf2 family protein